jgi:UDP-3-O-[3-hydroxymyristoyl] glucosamine N-acyltransferase
MNLLISKLADFVGGKIYGENLSIRSLAKIQEAKAGDLTFLYLPAYEKYFKDTKASAILVKPGFSKTRNDITYIEVKDPNKAFSKITIEYFSPDFKLTGIDSSCFIHPDALIGNNVALGKNVVISAGCKLGNDVKIFHNSVILEDCEIGDDSVIFPNVSIREKSIIGKRVIVHSGTVIGADGFGYFTDEQGKYIKIPQIGNVIIEDDVELGANVTVDRAALGSTIIRSGTKIDNLVQVAHNVEIGKDTVISSQTGISGSTKIGNHCMIAGQVGFIGHIEIADGTIIIAQSGISKSIIKPGKYFGTPAKEFSEALRQEAHIRNLSDYSQRIKLLEEELEKIKMKLPASK